MDARVASIRGRGSVERLQSQPGLSLAQLQLGLRGKNWSRVRIFCKGRGCALRCLRDFAFMQQSLHKRRVDQSVMRLLHQGFYIFLFRVCIPTFAIGNNCGSAGLSGRCRTGRGLTQERPSLENEDCKDPTESDRAALEKPVSTTGDRHQGSPKLE